MSKNSDFLPWVEKYRPKKLNQIISHNNILNSLNKIIKNGSLPHLLFHGTPGTGKTSTILSVAKKLYGSDCSFMVLELNASDDRGISSVRQEIKGFAESINMFRSGIKLIILDEADSMTYDAQFALRRIIEEHSETVRFCLICNYINKIILAIRSRCMIFRFSPIPMNESLKILKNICEKEDIKHNIKTLKSIIKICRGDLRGTINLLQSINLQYNSLDNISGYKITGIPDPKDMKKILLKLLDEKKDFNYCLKIINKLIEKNGYSIDSIISELHYSIIDNMDKIPSDKLGKFLIELAKIEYQLCSSTFDDIYIGAIVGVFKE